MRRTDSWKDPDAGKDWRQEEKGMTEDEMVGWHHWLNGPEFEQAPGVGDGQESLACCSPWGSKELAMTEWLNWTDKIYITLLKFPSSSARPSLQEYNYFLYFFEFITSCTFLNIQLTKAYQPKFVCTLKKFSQHTCLVLTVTIEVGILMVTKLPGELDSITGEFIKPVYSAVPPIKAEFPQSPGLCHT